MSRLEKALGQPSLVGYLVGGFPDEATFLAHADALIENGCRVLEVGIPFSEPVADGPTIQRAVKQALDQGVRPRDVLSQCARIRENHPEIALVVMTYANIAHAMGWDGFARALTEAGVDGAILADLPPEHAGPVQDAFGDELDLVFLASPATGPDRLDKLLEATRGFLYLVGLFGVTGAREELEHRTVELLERVAPKAHEQGVPVGIGFGVSKGEHARTLAAAGADGVIVGSAFLQMVLDGAPSQAIGELAKELADGVAKGASER